MYARALGETTAAPSAPSFWDTLLNTAAQVRLMEEQRKNVAAGILPAPVSAPVSPIQKYLPLAIGALALGGLWFVLGRKRGRRR